MWDPDPGQNEEAGVVCSPVEPLGTRGVIPADEFVPRSRLPSRGTEEQAGNVTPMTVAGQVGKMLSDRASVAQVMVTGEVAGEGAVFGMLGAERLKRDRGEFTQARGDGCGDAVEAGEFGRLWLTLDGWAPGQWQRNPAMSRQLEHQGAGGHVLEPPGVSAPVPNLSEFLRETTTMPVWMGSDQVPDIDEVLFSEGTALNM